MNRSELATKARTVTGRKVKKLRQEGLIPANIFGKKVKSTAISVDAKEFEKVFKSAGETALVDLVLGKDKRAVLIRNVQKHPIDESVLHVDFQQVDLKEKVTAQIPVEVIGESPAEKQGIGTVVQQMDEVEVEALPTDLPEKFEVDVTELAEVDAAIYVKDLKFDKSIITITDDLEQIIVKVEPPTVEEVIEPVAPVEGEVPAEGGETPVEGTDANQDTEENPKE